MKLLIDADVDAFAAAASAEKEFDWGDDIYSLTSDLSDAKRTILRRVRGYKQKLGVDDFALCFTSPDNYRKDWLPTYKQNRTGRKPLGYYDLVEWCKTEFEVLQLPKLEADDVMGIYATYYPNEYTIVTIDKDLYSIPGRLARYKPTAPSEIAVEIITQEAADQFFLMQCITGDATDGFEGIGTKGWGPVTINKWLEKAGGLSWENVVKLYEHLGKTEEDAIMTARMARILTKDLYNLETGKITPWTPEHANFR